jgi:hypothetical protein
MILDRVDAAPTARYHKKAKSGRYPGAGRLKALKFLSTATFITVGVLIGLIAWASLT